ncbi:RagB/SusD family nutrient uptake outer membrane protein [Flavobacterium nackdongense]|uniref:RagB/SusD family nutrient uptake outer membrane protein n=2 Tax=Flavobacterium nackdongense TaxID=2547394 RepID=A0A4P6YHT7_9FLAO|nr:RagB/SusD family nutrient uptake outer membrane protein [Flavobacterium nackdongense]
MFHFKFNNMKNITIIKSFCVTILLSGILGCSDTLKEEVETFYSAEQVFSTKEGIETAVNGLYTTMSGYDYYGSGLIGLVYPISGRFYSNQTASADATSLNCTPENIWLPKMWGQMYATINVANNIIYNIENNGVVLDNEDFALAQARFIRGLTYFELVRLFGAVPLRTAPTTIANLHLAKSPKSVVYEQIISDFQFAKLKLPEAGKYLSDRPLKWAAYGYLAKVYMTLAGEDGGDPSKWQLANNEAIQMVGKYSLTTTYGELFTVGIENTKESIFELQFSQIGATRTSDVVRMFTPSNSTLAPPTSPTFGRIRPNKEVYDAHKNQYPGDPRIAATFIFDSYPRYPSGNQNIYPKQLTGNQSFACIRKFLDPGYNGTTTSRNTIVFRYADVLLMLAEIENELRGPAGAYQYVNLVLTRARNSVTPAAVQPANWAGMDQAQFRTRIMKERQYELLSEGHDWFDTRRRGYAYFKSEILDNHNNYAPNKTSGVDWIYPISEKNMLLPIPATELAGNQKLTAADQNPGY